MNLSRLSTAWPGWIAKSFAIWLPIFVGSIAIAAGDKVDRIKSESTCQEIVSGTRRLEIGPIQFAVRGNVDLKKLERFARSFSMISSALGDGYLPEKLLILVSESGEAAAGFRVARFAEFDYLSSEEMPEEVWIHELGHIIFYEIWLRHYPRYSDYVRYFSGAKAQLLWARFFEQGSKNEEFKASQRAFLSGNSDEASNLYAKAIATDRKMEWRLNKLPADPGKFGEAPKVADQLSRPYQELISDLLVEIVFQRPANADWISRHGYSEGTFRSFSVNDLSPDERALYSGLKQNEYTISMATRRFIGRQLAALKSEGEKWRLYERVIHTALQEIDVRMADPSLQTLEHEEFNRRFIQALQNQP